MTTAETETRERLLDVAERLFADHGIKATTLRQITAEAGANLASVNYYFQSKEALVQGVLARRFVPLNAERIRRLGEAEAEGSPTLEEVLRAFFEPTAAMAMRHPHFIRFASRVHMEPDETLNAYFMSLFGEIVARFGAALTRAVPDVPFEVLAWRMHFLIGSMINAFVNPCDIAKLTGGQVKEARGERLVPMLIEFGAAGLRARPTTP